MEGVSRVCVCVGVRACGTARGHEGRGGGGILFFDCFKLNLSIVF